MVRSSRGALVGSADELVGVVGIRLSIPRVVGSLLSVATLASMGVVLLLLVILAIVVARATAAAFELQSSRSDDIGMSLL